MHVCAYGRACVCVCVCEGERGREREIVGASCFMSMRVIFPDLRRSVTTIQQSAKNAGERDSRNEPLATLRMQCKLYSSVAFGIKCNINSYGGIHGNNTVYG